MITCQKLFFYCPRKEKGALTFLATFENNKKSLFGTSGFPHHSQSLLLLEILLSAVNIPAGHLNLKRARACESQRPFYATSLNFFFFFFNLPTGLVAERSISMIRSSVIFSLSSLNNAAFKLFYLNFRANPINFTVPACTTSSPVGFLALNSHPLLFTELSSP